MPSKCLTALHQFSEFIFFFCWYDATVAYIRKFWNIYTLRVLLIGNSTMNTHQQWGEFPHEVAYLVSFFLATCKKPFNHFTWNIRILFAAHRYNHRQDFFKFASCGKIWVFVFFNSLLTAYWILSKFSCFKHLFFVPCKFMPPSWLAFSELQIIFIISYKEESQHFVHKARHNYMR